MASFLEFISFNDPGVFAILMGTLLVSFSSTIIGTFTFLRKKALVGDAVSHSVFPGICLAFILAGEKDPLLLIFGAFISGWISVFFIDYIVKNSKIKADSAISITLSLFFALGAVLMSYIQNGQNPNQSGINHFLFGKAASITMTDVKIFLAVFVCVLSLVVIFYKQFVLICFNEDYAKSIGLRVKTIDFLISSLTVLVIASGIQTVGVVLMAALLITPPGAAGYWTQNVKKMIFIGLVFSGISAFSGSYISFAKPNMPTGPWIVFVLSILAIFSMLFSPKGMLKKYQNSRNNRLKILNENILKSAYYLAFEMEITNFSRKDIISNRAYDSVDLENGLKRLKKHHFLLEKERKFKLTEKGEREAKRIVRLHRLWELYLTNKMNFKSDHIHGIAETIEHIITPDIEAKLREELGNPEKDPHNSMIP